MCSVWCQVGWEAWCVFFVFFLKTRLKIHSCCTATPWGNCYRTVGCTQTFTLTHSCLNSFFSYKGGLKSSVSLSFFFYNLIVCVCVCLRGQGTEGLINQKDLVDVALCCSVCALTKKSRRSYCWPETSALRANWGVSGNFNLPCSHRSKSSNCSDTKSLLSVLWENISSEDFFFSSQGPRQNTLNSSLCVMCFFMFSEELVFSHLKRLNQGEIIYSAFDPDNWAHQKNYT